MIYEKEEKSHLAFSFYLRINISVFTKNNKEAKFSHVVDLFDSTPSSRKERMQKHEIKNNIYLQVMHLIDKKYSYSKIHLFSHI
jgi:hypothetical protein